MQIITHRNHLDAIPESPLKAHIQNRFNQLAEDTDVPPNLILVESGDDITGPDYAFVGPEGLLSDLMETHEPRHPEFFRPYEFVSLIHIQELAVFEILSLVNGEDAFWIYISKSIADANADLKWVLTDESQGGLSDPQPLQ